MEESSYNARLHDGVLEGKDATLEQRLQQRLYGIRPPYASSPTYREGWSTSNSRQHNFRDDSFLASASQRRYLMHDGADMQPQDPVRSSLLNDHGSSVKKNLQSALSEVILNMTINDSASELKSNIVSLKHELAKLCREEEAKKKEHNFFRGELQESWDKLVNLRTHISIFRTAIEEATIEEVAEKAESDAWRHPDSPSGGAVALTVESALRLADIQAVREKVRLKEGLRRKLALLEEILYDLRNKLSEFSEELTKASVISDREIVPASLSRSMDLRHAIILISKDLEETEEEFVKTNQEIELIELELSAALQRVDDQKSPGKPPKLAIEEQMLTIREAMRPDDNNSHNNNALRLISTNAAAGHRPVTEIALAMKGGKESATRASKGLNAASNRCDFSLNEVLSGDARVVRLNGEPAKTFRSRLEKRLSSLLLLDEQLQTALEEKTDDVKRAREMLREVEVQRLRVELQLSNAENNVRQLELENMRISAQQQQQQEQQRQQQQQQQKEQQQQSHHPGVESSSSPKSRLDTGRGTGRSTTDDDSNKASSDNRRLREAAELLRGDLADPSDPASEESKTAGGGRSRTPTNRTSSPQKNQQQSSNVSPKRGTAATSGGKSPSSGSPRFGSPTKDPARSSERSATTAGGLLSVVAAAGGAGGSMMPISGIIEDTSLSKRSVRKPERVTSQLMQQGVDRPYSSTNTQQQFRERSNSFDTAPASPTQARGRGGSFSGGVSSTDRQQFRRSYSHSPPSPSSRRQSLIPVRTDRVSSLTHTPGSHKPHSSGAGSGLNSSRLRFADEESPSQGSGNRGVGSSGKKQQQSPQSIGNIDFTTSVGSLSSSGGLRNGVGSGSSSALSLADKLERFRTKLAEAKREETINPVTGIAVDIHRHGVSLGYLEVAVIGARNLPEVKKITRSADPYVELRLATVTEGSEGLGTGDPKISTTTAKQPAQQRGPTALTTAVSPAAATVVEFKTEDDDPDKVLRTAVQWQNRFPEWREFFKVSPITSLNQAIVLTVKDFSKMGLHRDEVIGQCALPMNMLLDQQHHRFWLQVQAPDFKKLWSGKFPQNCALRVECKLFYSKVKLWQYRIDEINELMLHHGAAAAADAEVLAERERRGGRGGAGGGGRGAGDRLESSYQGGGHSANANDRHYRPATATAPPPRLSSTSIGGPHHSNHSSSSGASTQTTHHLHSSSSPSSFSVNKQHQVLTDVPKKRGSPRQRGGGGGGQYHGVDDSSFSPSLRSPQQQQPHDPYAPQPRTAMRVLGLHERPVNVVQKSAFDIRVSRVEMRTADDRRVLRGRNSFVSHRSQSLSAREPGAASSAAASAAASFLDDSTAPSIQGGTRQVTRPAVTTGTGTNKTSSSSGGKSTATAGSSSRSGNSTVKMGSQSIQEIPPNDPTVFVHSHSRQPNLSIFKKAGAQEVPHSKFELKAQAKRGSGVIAFGSKGVRGIL